ncbi:MULTISPECIES: hypothetical protein [Bacillaceae]|uniref:hypothetical protein n=1 Tax=Bacillaceae TaxID=186817 RepID=UPI001E47459B|nr:MULTISPECIES: hypothetical protein [Bacillaceae]MCE4050292.1 hypothetical protein [Bacillus sp. Au-Bac7]MCM3029527.1 hypothetical protein [Niallia sp. MER 6]MDL0435167.1 hypothetical protein [Niallia sp. SS-2023]UPO87067.1 hypothetical protein L8T27_016090 [Niallia sp. Man26]
MQWKKMIIWLIGIVIGIGGLTASVVFAVLIFLEKDKPLESKSEKPAVSAASSQSAGSEDMSTEPVHEPMDESIVTLADGSSGHDFISDWHDFYNETLGWGKLETADYTEQKEAAESILSQAENMVINNSQISADLDLIKEAANLVAANDNRDAMRSLHRYFHDLDIYFNGYDYTQTFGVTSFKGE